MNENSRQTAKSRFKRELHYFPVIFVGRVIHSSVVRLPVTVFAAYNRYGTKKSTDRTKNGSL